MYALGTFHLGFTIHDEYKVMGLAPYGDPARFSGSFNDLVRLDPDGGVRILPTPEIMAALAEAARVPGGPIEQIHKDFAAALQKALERGLLHLVAHYGKELSQRKLCFAGGVAQNCSANGKLLLSDLFDDVFVQPVAYDAGCALGAALWAHSIERPAMPAHNVRMFDLQLGLPTARNDDLRKVLNRWEFAVDWTEADDIADTGAKLIADGAVIGWMQGRAEYGARALGNRSIIADPRPAENKDRINAMVKKREGFRPFAPSVIDEMLHEYFDVPKRVAALPFMVFVVPVREQYRQTLGAITHVDGTARVQSVARTTNEKYWRLIRAFGGRTGIPMVLNTSFNNNAEPIVNTPEDALNCFLSTDIDYLLIGDFLVRKRGDKHDALVAAGIRLNPRYALIYRPASSGRVQSLVIDQVNHGSEPVSHEVIRVLAAAARDQSSLRDAACKERISLSGEFQMELFNCWFRRVFWIEAPGAAGLGGI
jgi:carbamoyltransferase